MRLVFISSVTAMTPLRTISVTTGSVIRLFARPPRAERLGLDFLFIALDSVIPAKAGTHNHRHLGLSFPMPHQRAAAFGSPPSRGRQQQMLTNKTSRCSCSGVEVFPLQNFRPTQPQPEPCPG